MPQKKKLRSDYDAYKLEDLAFVLPKRRTTRRIIAKDTVQQF